jgi:hypothetical protein
MDAVHFGSLFRGSLDMKIFRLVLSAVAVIATLIQTIGAVGAQTEKRVALVIGNSAYQNTSALANPANDAEDIATALKSVGFSVILERNLTKRSMENAIAEFARLAQDADAAMFFYAGHGMQAEGRNYLIPTDAKFEDVFKVKF